MNTISFDLETTGLTANDEVISIALYEHGIENHCDDAISQDNNTSEEQLLRALCVSINAMEKDVLLVTFNGNNWKGGFDFPLLRTRMHKHGISWPFSGMMHVDIYPVIEKRWNTAAAYWQTLDQLLVDELKTMMSVFDINAPAKVKQNYIDIIRGNVDQEQIDRYIQDNFESKVRDINNLKGAYQIITGKDPGSMDGLESVKLWTQYKETGDISLLERIREYNIEDCRKTLELYEICKMYCSKHDMKPEIL